MNFNDLVDKFNSGILTEADIEEFEYQQCKDAWKSFKHEEDEVVEIYKKPKKQRNNDLKGYYKRYG